VGFLDKTKISKFSFSFDFRPFKDCPIEKSRGEMNPLLFATLNTKDKQEDTFEKNCNYKKLCLA
jgi:hypothetical protein